MGWDFCGDGRNRTADTRIFSPLLYRLSYITGLAGRKYKDIFKTVNKNRTGIKKTDLVIDIGNSRIKMASFRDDKLLEVISFRKKSVDEISGLISKLGSTRAILSAVTAVDPQLYEVLNQSLHLIELKHDTPIPISLDYATPATLGVDRIANAVAAAKFYPNSDVLIIDFGTCIKYDLIEAAGIFKGGAISPGLNMRFKSMHQMTGKLPLITQWEAEKNTWPGKSTRHSMASGVIQGVQGEMMQFIELAANDYDDLIIISTGGDYTPFEKAFKNIIFAHPYLTLEGIHEILQYNVNQN